MLDIIYGKTIGGKMREIMIAGTIMFLCMSLVLLGLQSAQGKSYGFTNICGDEKLFCLRKVVEKKPVPPEFVTGAKHYKQCSACHGVDGSGGMGPALAGQTNDMIVDKLTQYRNGDTIGTMSNIMWSQSSWMTDKDIRDIANYVETL